MNDLRDEFAKAALQGMLADPKVRPADWEPWPAFCQVVADECYDLADAMLVAREKGVAKPEAPALDEYSAYDQWRKGDVLRVLTPTGSTIPVGSLVTHDDHAGEFDPFVLYNGERCMLASPQLEFVRRP